MHFILLVTLLICCSFAISLSPDEALGHVCKGLLATSEEKQIYYNKLRDDEYQLWKKNLPPSTELLQSSNFTFLSPNSTIDLLLKLDNSKLVSTYLNFNDSDILNVTNSQCIICLEENAQLFFDGCGATTCQQCYNNIVYNNLTCPNCRGPLHNVFNAMSYLLDKTTFPFQPVTFRKKSNFTALINMLLPTLSGLNSSFFTFKQKIPYASRIVDVSNSQCIICFNEKTQVFFDGCGTNFCQHCYKRLKKLKYPCPMCRGRYRAFSSHFYLLDKNRYPFKAYNIIESKLSGFIERIYFLFFFDVLRYSFPFNEVELALLELSQNVEISTSNFDEKAIGLKQTLSILYKSFIKLKEICPLV